MAVFQPNKIEIEFYAVIKYIINQLKGLHQWGVFLCLINF